MAESRKRRSGSFKALAKAAPAGEAVLISIRYHLASYQRPSIQFEWVAFSLLEEIAACREDMT